MAVKRKDSLLSSSEASKQRKMLIVNRLVSQDKLAADSKLATEAKGSRVNVIKQILDNYGKRKGPRLETDIQTPSYSLA